MKNPADAIHKLLTLESMNCGSSEAAAAVLLAAYNTYDFPLQLNQLCTLDADHYRAAMTVIHTRVLLGREPHELIANGSKIFQQMAIRWRATLGRQTAEMDPA